MKYIIMEDFSGEPAAFIFPRRVSHEDMREQLPYARAISCGYLEIGPEGFICSGGCPELGLQARVVDDAKLIASALKQQD